MRFGLLGPIEVIGDDGQPVALAGERERTLLATLALAANQVVSTERLVEALWGEHPPATAGNALQVQISKLRKKLAGANDRQPLRTAPQGYILASEPGELDIERFEGFIERAPADPVARSARLRDALAVWRGPALADVVSDLLEGERARLAERRMAVLEDRIETDLALGRHNELVSELEALVRAHPLREGLRGQLMLALYRSGRQADALASFSAARKVLTDELGIDPSPELQALEVSMLRHDANLAAPAQIDRSDLHVPLTEETADNNLPAQLSSFIGREAEIAEVHALVQRARLVTLTGAGGAGKTRLALAAASRLLDGSGDGVWFVDLAPLVDSQPVAATVASVLGVRDDVSRPIDATVIDWLATRHLLLVLDNCEHVLDSCAPLVDQLLRGCPRVHVLATSRQPLGIIGEQLYRVPPLQLPTDDLQEAEESEAVLLFLDRARDQDPGFALNDHTRTVVARLCRRLDGMPLAIELACGRLRSLAVNEVDARLDERFRLLTGGSRTALPRQQTLQALIDWSYELLTQAERAVFVRLAVFAGTFDLRAAESVCGSSGVDMRDVLDVLGSLVDKSLVHASPVGETARFRLLETVREYAADVLRRNADELLSARDAHANYYLGLAEEAAPHLVGRDQDEWLTRLEHDHDNLRGAAAYLLSAAGSADRALRFGVALRNFWHHVDYLGHFREGLDLLCAALTRSDRGEPSIRAAALATAAGLAANIGELPLAETLLDEGLDLAVANEALHTQAICLDVRAWLAFERGDYLAALAVADEAIERARRSGDSGHLAQCLRHRGGITASLDHRRSIADLTEALTYFREAGSPGDVSMTLTDLGVTALEQGDLESAREFLRDAIAEAPPGPSPRCHAILALGWAALFVGDGVEAMPLFAQCLVLYGGRGWTPESVYVLIGVAISMSAVGEHETAATLHGAADAAVDQMGIALEPFEAKLRDQDLLRLREAMGAEPYGRAYDVGRAMAPDDALDLAAQRLRSTAAGVL